MKYQSISIDRMRKHFFLQNGANCHLVNCQDTIITLERFYFKWNTNTRKKTIKNSKLKKTNDAT